MIRVAIAAASPVARAGLESLVASSPGMEVAGALPDLRGVEALRPDVALVFYDLDPLPPPEGEMPPIVLLAPEAQPAFTRERFQAGVRQLHGLEVLLALINPGIDPHIPHSRRCRGPGDGLSLVSNGVVPFMEVLVDPACLFWIGSRIGLILRNESKKVSTMMLDLVPHRRVVADSLHSDSSKIESATVRAGSLAWGHVGLPLARAFGDRGIAVLAWRDVDPEKLPDRARPELHWAHPGFLIRQMREQGFEATTSFSRLAEADVVIVVFRLR